MKICISKLQTYISILTLIQIVYHVYILFSDYTLHWFSRVLFIATHREIMSLTELIKVENVNKYPFPKLKKNEISMFLCCKNVNILLAAKYCTLTWCNSFMQTYIIIQSVFCVYISFSEYVLGWFFPVLFIATYGEQMYTIDPNASQTHVLFCDFFKQLIWKSFRNITEVCEIIKYRHIHEPCLYISLTLYHDIFSIPVAVSVYQQMWLIKTCFLRSITISKMYLLEFMYPHFVFNLSVISIKKDL